MHKKMCAGTIFCAFQEKNKRLKVVMKKEKKKRKINPIDHPAGAFSRAGFLMPKSDSIFLRFSISTFRAFANFRVRICVGSGF
jgi:hypothetical protein